MLTLLSRFLKDNVPCTSQRNLNTDSFEANTFSLRTPADVEVEFSSACVLD